MPEDDTAVSDLEWAVIHTLVEANVQTTQTLEQFYYHRHYSECGGLDEIQASLRDAIDTHEEIQDDLESLLSLLDRLDGCLE